MEKIKSFSNLVKLIVKYAAVIVIIVETLNFFSEKLDALNVEKK